MKLRHIGYGGLLGLLGLLGLVFDQPGLFGLFGFYGLYAFFGINEPPAANPTALPDASTPTAGEIGPPSPPALVTR